MGTYLRTKIKLLLVVALFFPNTSSANETIHLQLRWHHQFQFAGYYAALEKGFYKKAGLDVILHSGTPEKMPIKEVLQGRAQYGVANSELLLQRLRGAPLVALAAIYQHSPSVLIARKDSGIHSPDDLIGKKVMMIGRSVDADFIAMFSNEHLVIKDIDIIPSSFEIKDLIDGKVDAFNSYISNEPYFLQQNGIEFTVLNPRNYGVDFYSDILFTTEDEIKHHPQRVKAFRQASLEGWYYALNHPQEIIDLLLSKYKVPKSRDHLEFEAETIRSLIIPDVVDLGHMNPWRWRYMAETFVQTGMVKNDRALEGFIYTLNPIIDREKLTRYLKIAVIFVVIVSFIALILYTAYRSIKRENIRRIAIEKQLRDRTNELALHNQILHQINQGQGISKILDKMALQIEALHPGMLCSILLLDTEGEHLFHGAAPSLPSFYQEGIDGLKIGDGAGSCGTAAFLKKQVIVEDINQHPYWDAFRDLAKQANVRSCWSQPILNHKGEILGTFAFYHKQPTLPNESEIKLIENYAGLAQVAIESMLANKALLESEERLRFVLEGSQLGFWDWKIDTNKIERDPVWAEMLGYTHEEILGTTQHWLDFIYPDDREMAWQSIQDILEGRSLLHKIEYRMIHKNGTLRWILDHAKVVQKDQNDRPIRISGTHADITDRKAVEAELRIAAAAFESQEGMIVTDANNIIIKVNHAFTEITGYTASEAVGQTPQSLLRSDRQSTAFYTEMWNSLKQNHVWQGEIWNRRKNGNIYPEWLTITEVKSSDGRITHYVATFTDITERKEAEEKIKQLAFYDPLTQLPNRRLLLERLKHSIEMERREGRQLALLMLDLDHFKAVNDNLGHVAGDQLLQQVAARIKSRLREKDVVARLGGDEFVVLLEDITHPENAARIAEDIVADLSKPFQLNNNDEVRIGASIGISLYPEHGSIPEILMNSADTALYQAKNEGRGCFAYFSENLTLAARKRIAMETRLRQAIEQQELRVYYQPQIDIASGRIIGAEALVRWQHPIEGLIFPGQFIPIAEETGLILDIGDWILRETCRQGRQWLDQGLPALTLSVNVSPHQFRRKDINALVATVLSETGYPAEWLALEITETGLMENQDKAMAILNDLRAQGIRLAIDDFGTGYSSLAYLKYFPLDVLKIDKSFIDDIPFLQGDMEITATIIAMAHNLGFKVSAEGVETTNQLAFLRDQGCDSFQGYLHSQALPPDDLAKLLRKS
jgi:diguanylate cyclase (GGDEF)-like protein/PAS domain S-box-containing protein